MKDRLIAGGFAGAVAGLIQNLYGNLVKFLGVSDRAFADFALVMITFKPYSGFAAFLVGIISHTIVGTIFGVIFAYIILITSSRYNLIKGLGFGAVLWFLLSGFGTIFRLPLFKNIPPGDAISTFVGALIYGILTAYGLMLLDKRTKLL